MSNNKQSMKLYTEEEVQNMLYATWAYSRSQVDDLIFTMKPLQLPSDEEIVNKALEIEWSNTLFKDGAIWMRDKIQGGNK